MSILELLMIWLAQCPTWTNLRTLPKPKPVVMARIDELSPEYIGFFFFLLRAMLRPSSIRADAQCRSGAYRMSVKRRSLIRMLPMPGLIIWSHSVRGLGGKAIRKVYSGVNKEWLGISYVNASFCWSAIRTSSGYSRAGIGSYRGCLLAREFGG